MPIVFCLSDNFTRSLSAGFYITVLWTRKRKECATMGEWFRCVYWGLHLSVTLLPDHYTGDHWENSMRCEARVNPEWSIRYCRFKLLLCQEIDFESIDHCHVPWFPLKTYSLEAHDGWASRHFISRVRGPSVLLWPWWSTSLSRHSIEWALLIKCIGMFCLGH